MHPILNKRIAITLVSLSIIFSLVSWSTLLKIKKFKPYLRPEIVISLEEGRTITISSLPSKIILPLIIYFPFWFVTFFTIHVFRTLEKRRKIHSPIYQQEI